MMASREERGRRKKGGKRGKTTHVQGTHDRFMIQHVSSPPVQGVDSDRVSPPIGHVFVFAWHPCPRTVLSQPLSLGPLHQFRRGIKPLSPFHHHRCRCRLHLRCSCPSLATTSLYQLLVGSISIWTMSCFQA